jgi:microcystin-dependent protein
MAFWNWSKTAANNATADPTVNWPEGQSPSSVNDSARAMMSVLAQFRDDTSGLLATAGSSTAYTVTTNQGLAATPNDGQLIAITPNVTNGAGVTLQADAGGTFPIQTAPGVAVPAATLIAGTPYTLKYSASAVAWITQNFYSVGSPGVIPVGGMIPYGGTTAPSSAFALPFGQAISRTTFSALFTVFSTTFGVGDGATTFNIPDLRGRSPFGVDNMGGVAAGRIGSVVTDTGTVVGTTLGSAGGSATHTQVAGEVGAHNHAITDPGHLHVVKGASVGAGGGGFFNYLDGVSAGPTGNTNNATTGITINNSAAPSAMSLLNPILMMNWILRVQ